MAIEGGAGREHCVSFSLQDNRQAVVMGNSMQEDGAGDMMMKSGLETLCDTNTPCNPDSISRT